MGRVIHMEYPDGWMEDYHYDALGQLTAIEDTDPSGKDMKQQKNVFEYDVCGNMVYEYMRGNGTGETTTEVFYTYDALHRVTSARENYGNAWRNYTYDSLGNLTYEENSNNVQYDYKLNDLNQITEKYYSGSRERTVYTYDGRGNLVLEEYGKNKQLETVASYVYDETNKMVSGTNELGEVSNYIYNGLGALVENQWIITKNGYGYHDVDAGDVEVTYPAPNLKKSSTVIKQFVIDYTRETMDPLMEHEVNGLDYRYVYGNERLSVNISPIENGAGHVVESGTVGMQIRLYYHQDLRGTVDYLTSPVSQKVESWTHYNEWGEITHNAVLKMGLRELDLVKNYTGHDYDVVLNLYYAKARMYDAGNRRFLSIDPILDGTRYDLTEYVYEVVNFTAYLYVRDNPLRWVDPLGLSISDRYITQTTLQDGAGTTAGLDSEAQSTSPKKTTIPTNKNSTSSSQNPNVPREQMYDEPSSGNNTPMPDDGPMEKLNCSDPPYDYFYGYYDKTQRFYGQAMYFGFNGPHIELEGVFGKDMLLDKDTTTKNTTYIGVSFADTEIGIAKIGYDGKYIDVGLETVTADAKLGINTQYIGGEIGARLIQGSVGVTLVPIPFTDKAIAVGATGELFGIGAEANWSWKDGLTFGASLLIGVRFNLNIVDR